MDARYTVDDSQRSRRLEPVRSTRFSGFGSVAALDKVRRQIQVIPGAVQVAQELNKALRSRSFSYYKNALDTLLAHARRMPLVGGLVPARSQTNSIWLAAEGFARMVSGNPSGSLGAVDDDFWDPGFLRGFATAIEVVNGMSPVLWGGAGVGATGGTAGGIIGLAGAGVGSIPGWVVDVIAGIVAATAGASNIAVAMGAPNELRKAATEIEKTRTPSTTTNTGRTRGGVTRQKTTTEDALRARARAAQEALREKGGTIGPASTAVGSEKKSPWLWVGVGAGVLGLAYVATRK